jgi:hypothetical protein
MATFQSTLLQLLLPALLIFLFAGSLVAILIGAGLILRAEAMFRLFGSMNRWVSMRKALRPVEIPRNLTIGSKLGPLLLGITFAFGAAISIVALLRTYEVATVAAIFKGSLPPVLLELAAQGAKWILLVGNAFALVAGLMLMFLPDAFARLAAKTDHWYSSRKFDKDMEAMNVTLDRWVQASPRAAGWILIVLGAFVVVNLAGMIFGKS